MIYGILAALVLCAITSVGSYFKGREDGAEPWIEQTAALEAQVHQMKTEGDDRAVRAEAQAKKATAELARVKKEAEAERAKWIQEASDGWNAYLDSQRVRVPDGADDKAALAACRADEAAARRAISEVVRAALDIRTVAILNTEQLRQLQEWLREASK
jgi:hypothetical protein